MVSSKVLRRRSTATRYDPIGPELFGTTASNVLCIGVILLLALSACDTEIQPAPMAPTPQPPVSPPASISISGVPPSPRVGESAQLTARITRQDGTTLDGTTQVAWLSSDVTVASISTAGLLTIATPGETDITATLQWIRAAAHVTVARPGPVLYDLDGIVHETAPTADVVVAGATVGIHYVGCPTCPHDNESTITDASGRFRLPGIASPGFSLVVTKPGYDVVSYGIVDLPRDQHASIGISPLGDKTETLAGECHSNVQESAATRVAVHHDGVLVEQLWSLPVTPGPGFSAASLSYRRVGVSPEEAFTEISDDDLFARISGGFFYEIRFTWLFVPACAGRVAMTFSHPN